MRIHTDHTNDFIQALTATISKDPSSLEQWHCIHVSYPHHEDAQWYGAILEYLMKSKGDWDCEIVQCYDNDLLFLSQSLPIDALYALANMFVVAASVASGQVGEIALYDMNREWRLVKKLLLEKLEATSAPVAKPAVSYFDETISFSDVFNDAKKRRNARSPLHVLLVEDDPMTRRMVAKSFKEEYIFKTVANAKEAVASYLLDAPDIVFLDIGLPDSSGFDVLHQIIAADANAYVVMFSANSYLDNVTAALTNGASGFVAKPFNKDKMRYYIQDSALHHNKYA